MLHEVLLYLSYPFVQYAFVVGILIALCSSLVGVTLVLKRYSYIGDGLSHIAFGAMAIANVLHLTTKMPMILVITIISAIYLLGYQKKIQSDSAITIVSVGSLAFGYLLMNLFSPKTNLSGDVCSTLFGSTSILTLTSADVVICVALSIVVVSVFVLLYNRIFLITFDETFAKASGLHVKKLNYVLAIVIGVIVVLAMNLVGSLLVSSLIVFPALSAMQFCKTYLHVIIVSALLSVTCALSGLLISILVSTPVGATIVVFQVVVFLICKGIGSQV